MYHLNPLHVADVANFMAPHDDPRKYLSVIHVEPEPLGGAYYVALDGIRLGVIHDPNTQLDRVLDLRPSKELLRHCARAIDGDTLVLQQGSVATFTNTTTAEDSKIAGKIADYLLIQLNRFPNWRTAIPAVAYALNSPCPLMPSIMTDVGRFFRRTKSYVLVRSPRPPDHGEYGKSYVITQGAQQDRIAMVMGGSKVDESMPLMPFLQLSSENSMARMA